MSVWTDNINRREWHWDGWMDSADGNQHITLDDSDFLENSIKLEKACSDTYKFALGGVITSQFSCTLVNIDQKFSDFNFDNASMVIRVGVNISADEETESLMMQRVGIFYCEKPTISGEMIDIVAYDAMDKFNKYCSRNYVASYSPLSSTVQGFCTDCGVLCNTDTTADNYFWQLPNRVLNETITLPETVTYRQFMSWILEICHGYAVIENNYLICKFLDHSVDPYSLAWVDGGQMWFGDMDVNGGTMSPWSSVRAYDGNLDLGVIEPIIFNSRISSEQITFSGVIIYPTTEGEASFQVGSDLYPLIIRDNPLITTNAIAHDIAVLLYDNELVSHPSSHSISGFFRLSFRPFEATVWCDPLTQCGQWVQMSDVNGNLYYAPITEMTIHGGGEVEIACNAQTYAEKKAEYAEEKYSIVQDAVTQANDYTDGAVTTAESNANDYTDTALSDKASWFSTQTFSITTASIASLGNLSNRELSITTTSGTTPIAICGWDVSTRAVVLAECHLKNVSGNTAKIEYSLYNAFSSARTPTVTFYVLCI